MAYLPGAISVCCAVVTVHDECKEVRQSVAAPGRWYNDPSRQSLNSVGTERPAMTSKTTTLHTQRREDRTLPRISSTR